MFRTSLPAMAAIIALAFVGSSSLRAQEAFAKKKSANNLRQLALAFHNYHDTMGQLPPPTAYSKDGKALYSWRVAILPFIDEDKLYKQFKLDEPWDSAHNKPLVEKMPKLFAPVTGKPKDKNATHYQVLVTYGKGAGAVFQEPKPGRAAKIRLTDITDGTYNTIMIVEAEEPVPWSKPADLTYDAEKPLPKFGGLFKEGFHVAFADGSVRFVKKDIDEKTLRALITRDEGEVVDRQKLEADGVLSK